MSSWAMPAGWKGAFQERELHEQRPWERCGSISLNLSWRSLAGERQMLPLMETFRQGGNLALFSGEWEAVVGL